jgi:carnitine O-acetyltransferase
MYLGGRYPVPINSNPFVPFESDPNHTEQASRAASLVFHMLKWRQGMFNGTVQPDGKPGKPACMDEYARLFATTRIPIADGTDKYVTDNQSRHIILLRGLSSFHSSLWPYIPPVFFAC